MVDVGYFTAAFIFDLAIGLGAGRSQKLEADK